MNVIPHPASRVLLALTVALLCWVAFEGAQPPRALPVDAPPAEFSGERAMVHSRKFAIEPRARGGAAAARGRDYLVRELQALGVEVQIQRDPVNHLTNVSFVENVLARIPGTANTKTIGMTAHYDSVAWGPGAADDGAGVVVMLEVARALKCLPPLKEDVVFIFTGDEEGGGNGSVKSLSHPWLKDLNIMIGLEGRGSWGTAFMFETSAGNLPLLQELKKSGAPAVSNSIMYQVHSQTPNTTDFTHMTKRGALGYNVAFVGGLQYYHTANDKPEHLCPDTLQHQGEYILSLLKHYGNDGPKIAKGDDAVFFNTIGKHLVVYSVKHERTFAIIAVVAFVLALAAAFATKGVRIPGLLGGIGFIVLCLALSSAIAWGLQWTSYKLFYVYIMYNAAYYQISFFLLGFAIFLGLFTVFRERLTPENMHAAALFIWLGVLATLEYGDLSVATYAGTWPLFFGAIGLAAACGLRRAGAPRGLSITVQLLSALPVIFIAVPGMHALYHMGGAITPVVNTAILLAVVMTISPALLYILAPGAKRLAIGAGVLALALFLAGWAAQRYSPDKPKMNSLTYGLNLDTNQALWLTNDKVSDEWVAQFVPNETASDEDYSAILPGRHDVARHAPAPVAPLAAPQLSVVSDETVDGKRALVLKYTTTRSPEETRITVLSPTHVLTATIDGMGEVLADSKDWSINVGYLPYNGEMTLRLTLEAATPGPVKVRVHETSFHLPELTTLGYRPRPDWMITKGNTLGWWEKNQLDPNHTWLIKTFEF